MTEATRAITGEIHAQSPVPLGNGTFTPDGRLIVSHHPSYETDERVSVFTGSDTLAPFPNVDWNTPREDSEDWLDAVLGIRTDSQGRVWMLDMGTRSSIAPKFVVWDCKADRLDRVLRLSSSALVSCSEPNDFVLDERRGIAYISDEGAGKHGDGSGAALIVVDTETGEARRLLEGRLGIRSDDRPLIIDGRELIRTEKDGRRIRQRVGVDGIAIDHAGEWLYFCALTGQAVWRLRTDDLCDTSLDGDALQQRMERYAERPNSGGMWMDEAGDLYLTEVEAASIGCIRAADRQYRRILTRDDLCWPDDVIPGPDNAMYIIESKLPQAPSFNEGKDRRQPPYAVIRFRSGHR
ncbi:MAG TPA: L-dopachrome tautomerase-related protein [Paracoccus sp. (in: a-proteobacteria)]|nr:L-dopachrome tautomerase-related protein [Paracoccus sp. (in: a-proteobacteria)]